MRSIRVFLFALVAICLVLAASAFALVVRQKDEARAVRPRGRKLEGKNLAEEPIRCLNQNAGAVTRIGFTPARAAVLQVDQDLNRLADDVVRATPLHLHDEADTTGVVLRLRVVQTWRRGSTGGFRV